MKKLTYIALFALSLVATSCRDDLETYAPGALTEETAIQNTSDLQQLLNSAYNILTSRTESEFVSVFTDETGIGLANGGQGITDWYVYFMTPNDSAAESLWGNPYLALARINRVIDISSRITPTNAADQQVLNRILAQAYTLRAYCHLVVMSYFSPDLTSDSALAGIIDDRVFKADDNDYPRNTNGEFYSFIHSDLDKAISIFNTNTATPFADPSVMANINFARGLKARAYAYKKDYTNAEIWANTVISTSGKTLATPAQYRSMFFSDSDTSEVIFKFKRTPQQNAQASNLHNAWCSVRPTYSGSPFYEISRALFNKLNTADVRYNVINSPSSVIDLNYATSSNYRQSDVLVINKHGGYQSVGGTTAATTSTNGFNNDIKIMRLSEMYFIKAEARVAANDLVGAATAVKSILDARYGTAQTAPVYATAQGAWKGILDQRRIEFAFEGYRFIDLKRLGTAANSGIDRDPADYSSSSSNFPGGNPSNLPLTSYKFALPIPRSETIVNTAIQQNQGY